MYIYVSVCVCMYTHNGGNWSLGREQRVRENVRIISIFINIYIYIGIDR